MAVVAEDDVDLHVVIGQKFVEPLPEVEVDDRFERLPFTALPPLSLPLRHPFAQALADVRAVGH